MISLEFTVAKHLIYSSHFTLYFFLHYFFAGSNFKIFYRKGEVSDINTLYSCYKYNITSFPFVFMYS